MYYVCIALAPVANIEHVDSLLSMIANPDVAPVKQLTVGLIPVNAVFDPENDDPYEFITHWIGAYVPISLEKLTLFQNLSTELPTPPGGWPWVVNGTTHLTEAQAQTAVASVTFYTGFQQTEDLQLGQTVLNALKIANNLKSTDI